MGQQLAPLSSLEEARNIDNMYLQEIESKLDILKNMVQH